MQKVKNPTLEGEVVGSSGAPKKPFDKRWIIIGALILILVIVFIVLLVISNTNKNPQGDTTPPDPVVYESDVVGEWSCSDATVLGFYTDKTYVWSNPATDSAESGNYADTVNTVTLNRLSRVVNGSFTPITEKVGEYILTYGHKSISLQPINEDKTYTCTRSSNE